MQIFMYQINRNDEKTTRQVYIDCLLLKAKFKLKFFIVQDLEQKNFNFSEKNCAHWPTANFDSPLEFFN